MATECPVEFDNKLRDAAARSGGYFLPMINRTMGSSEWSSLLLLAVIWGSAFFLIDVAVAEVAPLTFVWVRLSLAAAALWLFLWARGQLPLLPPGALGAMVVLALLNNAVPFTLFAWSQTVIDALTRLVHAQNNDSRTKNRSTSGCALVSTAVLLAMSGCLAKMRPMSSSVEPMAHPLADQVELDLGRASIDRGGTTAEQLLEGVVGALARHREGAGDVEVRGDELGDLLADAARLEVGGAPRVRAARSDIRDLATAFVGHEQFRPFGWDDVCA